MGIVTRALPYYFPILRAKRGEIQALGALSPNARAHVRPLIDIPKQREKDRRTLSECIGEIICSLPATWGTGQSFYLDMSLFAANARIDDVHSIERVFEIANQAKLLSIPATGTLLMRGPEPDYWQLLQGLRSGTVAESRCDSNSRILSRPIG